MPTIEKLQPGSFRGISFLVNTETKTGGKKTVTHEFVNSNERFTEELGELPPNFSIEAIVHGDDAIQRRFDLERVLNQSGLGDLVHPVYGLIKVKSTTYSVSSNQTRIGEYRFSIEFQSTKENLTAQPTPLTNSAVSKAAEDAREAVNNAIGDDYIKPIIPDTLTSSADKLDEIHTDVNGAISNNVGLVQDKVAEFNRTVNDGQTNVLTTVQQGVKLKDSLESLYNSAISVVNQPQILLGSWQALTDFGFTDIKGDVNTVYRLNKENNNSVMNEHTRIMSMVNMFEAAVYTEFQTDQELQSIKDILDLTYQRLMKDFDQDIDTGSVMVLAEDPDIRTTVAELRTKTNKVMNSKEQNVFRVVQIDPGFTSMPLTAHRFYGDIENLNLLKTLNPSVNWGNFNEPIQAVSK